MYVCTPNCEPEDSTPKTQVCPELPRYRIIGDTFHKPGSAAAQRVSSGSPRVQISVLHCYADYKWTGPSGPIVQLCRYQRRAGLRSELACIGRGPHPAYPLAARAREAGVRVHDQFFFDSRPNLRRNLRDVEYLTHLINQGGHDLVHAHGSWDHVLAAAAAKRASPRRPIVRTDHGERPYGRNPLHRLQFSPALTDHLIVPGERSRRNAIRGLRLDPRAVTAVRGAVDCDEYRPMEPPGALRAGLGWKDDEVVFVVVARVQTHRRFDVLLEAMLQLKEQDPRVKLIVMGRGTHKAEVLDRPVREMDLQDAVVPFGYRRDDYKEVIASADAGIMLVPGSDASCRAAMEMAAMSKPLIVARRGVLPEIVEHGRTGLVVDDTPENLAAAILEMARDAPKRRLWGRAARNRMLTLFAPERQAAEVADVYRRVLECPPGLSTRALRRVHAISARERTP